MSDLQNIELAFEENVPIDSPPRDLFRVVSFRNHMDRKIRHVNWFSSESAASNHAKWIADGRGDVLHVSHYVLAESEEGGRDE